jgi:hypothetical protein
MSTKKSTAARKAVRSTAARRTTAKHRPVSPQVLKAVNTIIPIVKSLLSLCEELNPALSRLGAKGVRR